jgi:hypothetical protein
MVLLFEVVGLVVQGAIEVGAEILFRSARDTSDRRSLPKNGIVRCMVRAVEGRVHNIGTEWSVGSARVRMGHIRFSPSRGIVGARSIYIDSIKNETVATIGPRDFGAFEGSTVVIVTPKGELCVGFPPAVFNEVLAVLEGRRTITGSHNSDRPTSSGPGSTVDSAPA